MIDQTPQPLDPAADQAHCVGKICELVAQPTSCPRTLFQLGYNLGRLSELTGLGRGPFWDRWKDAVTAWDVARLGDLAHELQQRLPAPPPSNSSRFLGDSPQT